MRVNFLISIILIILMIFTSCENNKIITTEEMMSEIVRSFGQELHSCRYVYTKSASVYSRSYLSNELASLIYYGTKKEYLWELELMTDYAVRLSDDQSGCEIHIYKVRAKSDIDTVEKMLRRRLEYMKNRTVYIYTPENYEECIAGAEVYIFGNYALLLATPNNAKAIEILRGMID